MFLCHSYCKWRVFALWTADWTQKGIWKRHLSDTRLVLLAHVRCRIIGHLVCQIWATNRPQQVSQERTDWTWTGPNVGHSRIVAGWIWRRYGPVLLYWQAPRCHHDVWGPEEGVWYNYWHFIDKQLLDLSGRIIHTAAFSPACRVHVGMKFVLLKVSVTVKGNLSAFSPTVIMWYKS